MVFRHFRPPGFGEQGLRHEVQVFVFRVTRSGLQYLLLRPLPRQESVWRPVVETVELDEDLFEAALRGVRNQTGLDHAFDLVAPAPGLVNEIGDLQLVEWPLGYQVRDPHVRLPRRAHLAAMAWKAFDDALRTLPVDIHRQNLLQIHWRLVAA